MSALATVLPRPALPRVLLVDDHQVLLDGLARLLRSDFTVSTVKSTSGHVPRSNNLSCDAMVVGINTPDNFWVARKLQADDPDIPIVLLLASQSLVSLESTKQLGARAVLAKQVSAETLISTIRQVLKTKLPDTRPGPTRPLLTSRQTDVLRLIASGYSAKDVANALKLSVRTAEFHRANIMQRLRLHTTAQLTRYAVSIGLPLFP